MNKHIASEPVAKWPGEREDCWNYYMYYMCISPMIAYSAGVTTVCRDSMVQRFNNTLRTLRCTRTILQ